ncbi:hypothetical protein RJT34_02362 [Clitoria ternatea]|uniref:Uncharacterized protein n=1 Tax=Clitoria ternatea TaxID=43366 RepID=A0AAN9Q0B4_CLITE
MLGEFMDEYTVCVVDDFAMPQSGTGVKLVRDIMNQMLEAWKQITDASDEVSPPHKSQSSSRGRLIVVNVIATLLAAIYIIQMRENNVQSFEKLFQVSPSNWLGLVLRHQSKSVL